VIKVAWLTLDSVRAADAEAALCRFSGGREERSVVKEVTALQSGRWLNLELGLIELYFIHDWCRLLSRLFGCTAVGFVAFEGLWDYSIYHGGHEIAGMDAQTEARTFLFGDLLAGAELLGTPPATLKAYCRSYPIPESIQPLYAVLFHSDWGEDVRAFPDDEFDPWNEWAHSDFARHFGAKYPVEQSALQWRIDSCKEQWPTLPDRLDAHSERRFPRRWLGLERLHPRNWP